MHKKPFLLALSGLLSFALFSMQESAMQHFPEVKTKKAVEAAQAEVWPASKVAYSGAAVDKLVEKLLPELQNKIWLRTKADVLGAKSYELLGRWQLFQDQTVLAHALSRNGKIAAFVFLVTDDCVRLEWETLYSRENCPQKSITLQGYTATDIKIYFSKDSRFLVIHSPDSGLLQVIDIAIGKLVRKYSGVHRPMCCIDTALIAACDRDADIFMVDVLRNEAIFHISATEEQDLSEVVVAMSSDGGYFLSAYDGMLTVAEVSSAEVKASFDLREYVDNIVQVKKIYMHRHSEGQGGYYLVLVIRGEIPAAQEGGPPKRWNHVIHIDGSSRQCNIIGTIKDAPYDVVLFSRDKQKMLFATASNKIIFCTMENGFYAHRYPYEGLLVGLSFAPDGASYVMARASGRIDKYALTSSGIGLGKLMFDEPVHAFSINDAGDNIVAITSQGAWVCMFEEQTKKIAHTLHLDDQQFLYKLLARFHKDGHKIQVKGADIAKLPPQFLRAFDHHKVAEL